jgi:hypothetical protein
MAVKFFYYTGPWQYIITCNPYPYVLLHRYLLPIIYLKLFLTLPAHFSISKNMSRANGLAYFTSAAETKKKKVLQPRRQVRPKSGPVSSRLGERVRTLQGSAGQVTTL